MGSACVKEQDSITKISKIDDVVIITTPFNENEISILRKQMSVLMLHVEKNGNVLYTNLFTKYSHLMTKFHFAVANDFDLQKTLNDARLTFHIRRVFDIFESVIKSLDNNDKYETVMKRVESVGGTHLRYGLKNKDFQNFEDAFITSVEEILKESVDESIKKIWSKLLGEIIKHMYIGIQNKEKEELVKNNET